MSSRPARIARFVWALPCSILAIPPAILALLLGGSVRRAGHTIEVALRSEQSRVPGWVRACPFGAFTLGHVILGQSHEVLSALRAHERVHVRQYEWFGILFVLAYPMASAWAWLMGRSPYHGNAFERHAVRESHVFPGAH